MLPSRLVIALIDYDSGNLRSVQKALLKVGADVRVVKRPDEMAHASAVVLPGVGAFDDCVNAMQKQELLGAIKDFIKTGRPVSSAFASATRPSSSGARSSIVARRASGYLPAKWSVFLTRPGSKFRKLDGTAWISSGLTAQFFRGSLLEVMSILFIVFFPSRPTLRLPRPRPRMAKFSPRLSGATTCMRHNFTRRRVRRWACNY